MKGAENRVTVAPSGAKAPVLCGLPHTADLVPVPAGHRELHAPTRGGSRGGPPPATGPAWRPRRYLQRVPRGAGRLPPRPPGPPPPRALLTETPYLSAMPCSVSPARTRCSTRRSMTPAPSGARTLAVLPYERVLVRARLSDSSASSASEPGRERGGGEGAEGRGARGPPSRRGRAGESAMGPAEASRSRSSPRGRRLRRLSSSSSSQGLRTAVRRGRRAGGRGGKLHGARPRLRLPLPRAHLQREEERELRPLLPTAAAPPCPPGREGPRRREPGRAPARGRGLRRGPSLPS